MRTTVQMTSTQAAADYSKSLPLAVRFRLLFSSGRFRLLQSHAGGMLHWRTYRQIYRTVSRHPDLDAVEIGGGTGAGSIAAAWAYTRRPKSNGRLVVVEKFAGGSRARDGSYEENLAAIEKRLEHFGVRHVIQLYPHALTLRNGHEVLALVKGPQIGTLIHDADGRIDRDFQIFWPSLVPDGGIVIDDCEPYPRVPQDDMEIRRAAKKALTVRLVELLTGWGLIKAERMVNGALFARKPSGADWGRFDSSACADVVESVKRQYC